MTARSISSPPCAVAPTSSGAFRGSRLLRLNSNCKSFLTLPVLDFCKFKMLDCRPSGFLLRNTQATLRRMFYTRLRRRDANWEPNTVWGFYTDSGASPVDLRGPRAEYFRLHR